VGFLDGAEDDFLAHFFRPAFHHGNGGLGAGHNDVHAVDLGLIESGVDDVVFAVETNTHGGYRAREGNV
jgi:hypothetical protein